MLGISKVLMVGIIPESGHTHEVCSICKHLGWRERATLTAVALSRVVTNISDLRPQKGTHSCPLVSVVLEHPKEMAKHRSSAALYNMLVHIPFAPPPP
jgi:hypothetical protein